MHELHEKRTSSCFVLKIEAVLQRFKKDEVNGQLSLPANEPLHRPFVELELFVRA